MEKFLNNLYSNRKLFYLVKLPRIISLIFLIEIFIAMIFYPGGTFLDGYTSGYIFDKNFLSDLGRWKAWNDNQNFISFLFFNLAFIQAGLTYMIFYIKMISLFKKDFLFYKSSIFGSFFGFLGGLLIMGVGFTPSDIFSGFHIIFAIWFIRFFLISSIVYIYIFLFSKNLNSLHSLVFIIYSLIILVYILIGEFGPKINTGGEFALQIHVVSQKIVAFSSIFLILFITFVNKKLII